MQSSSNLEQRVRDELNSYCSVLGIGLSKPQRKFVQEMIYGMQASQDVKLSNISRSLNEQIKLIKTENRLSRNLQKEDLTDHINSSLLEQSASQIKRETVISIDISDLSKPHAESMEHLSIVRNGSDEGTFKPGYWLLGVYGAELSGADVIPLYQKLYSHTIPSFRSENNELEEVFDMVCRYTGTRGIWVMDRGGDRKVLYCSMLERSLRFVVRLRGDRTVIAGNGHKMLATDIGARVSCQQHVDLKVTSGSHRIRRRAFIGSRHIRLPFCPDERFRIVVVKGLSNDPLLLLTNAERKSDKQIVECYLTRWKCEESFRFIKQSYNLEDVRVRSYVALRNIVVLLHSVFHFLSLYLGMRGHLRFLVKEIITRAKRFFAVSGFRYYALSDGLHWILGGARRIVGSQKNVTRSFLQLSLNL